MIDDSELTDDISSGLCEYCSSPCEMKTDPVTEEDYIVCSNPSCFTNHDKGCKCESCRRARANDWL